MEAQAYLYTDIQPVVKYFTHQDFHASISKETKDDVMQQFAEKKPAWVVIEIDQEGEPIVENEDMKKFLQNNYEIQGQEENRNRNERYGIYRYRQ